jgi:hypothetical protein
LLCGCGDNVVRHELGGRLDLSLPSIDVPRIAGAASAKDGRD